MTKNKQKILRAKDAVKLTVPLILDWYKEHFFAVYLNSQNRAIKVELVSMGSLTANIVHPREVFKLAIIKNAVAIIVLHNHPSGDVSPSKADKIVTKRLVKAGKIFGIKVVDHIIFNKKRDFYSFCEAKLIK